MLISSLNTNGDTFQSTPSVGRATIRPHHLSFCLFYFNPRPPWGGRRRKRGRSPRPLRISIHALRGEGDRAHFILEYQRRHISIHALRGETSTLSSEEIYKLVMYFNPRPPWGGRHLIPLGFPIFIRFQSHALREGDKIGLCLSLRRRNFNALRGEGRLRFACCPNAIPLQSTPSVGATRGEIRPLKYVKISIHALRGEGD